MEDIKILYLKKISRKDRASGLKKYQLLEYHCDIVHPIGSFDRQRDVKKYVKAHFTNYELKKIHPRRLTIKKPLIERVERVYIKLEGKTIRNLSWGMDWHRVSKTEQIEGSQTHLTKTEIISGCESLVHLGFNEWANCGLEYIAYSSANPAFYDIQLESLTRSYGKSEKIVDFRGLDRLLKKGHFKSERMLSYFLKTPNSPFFNRFIKNNTQLTFRSAQKWETETDVVLLYKKLTGCPGERNGINLPIVVEYMPKQLFDFFEEAFAQLFIHP